jgi:hypothetical protein
MNTFLPICKKAAERVGQTGRSLLLLAALGLPSLAQAQTVAFPRNASFTGTDASGFVLGGNAFLTAKNSTTTNGVPSGNAIDGVNSGALRLTEAVGNQAGYAIDQNTFATPNGFSISFEFFSYGTTSNTVPADGFSVFLVDGTGTDPSAGQFKIGGIGGSLGYAANTVQSPANPGVTKGYLGIGIDEFGNFSNPTEGRIGGPGAVPNVIALRGDYTTNYNYLTGTSTGTTSTFKPSLAVSGTTRTTDPGDASGNYRKAYINVVPTTTNGVTTYKVTIRIQNGQAVTTAINSFTITNPPSTLRVGFAASTGGNNSIHEIRALAIVQAPIAVDDNVSTPYNKAITFSALANDLNGGGAVIDPATIDLNPNTIGRETTLTVAQGTFSVDNTGNVTFTPIGNFSGTVSIPYTVQNVNKDISNLGNITVTVTGADVETVVSGPTAVNPGTMTTYTVTTTNNGVETATNVRPTLTLPAGFSVFGPLPTGASISGSTITFAPTTLTARQSTTNTLQVTATSTTGNYSLVSNYSYPSGGFIPDILGTNNSSTLAVTVAGAANIAGVCSVPGKDGVMTLTASSTPNTYYAATASASAGSKSISVATPTGNTATPIAKGDLLLIMQMQGATMNTTNSTAYGTVTAATAGTYEYAVADGPVTGGTLTLAKGLQNAYSYNVPASTTNPGTPFQQFQVIRIPQYSALTVSGTVTGLAWNGSTGGVLALEVAGATTFNTGASLNMDGKGFRGGPGKAYATATDGYGSTTTYVAKLGLQNPYAAKGEGIVGIPAGLGATTSYENYANGSYALGRAGTAGGGGLVNPNDATYSGSWTGGGGGANGGNGSNSQNATNVTTSIGGAATPIPSTTQLYLGSGGGAGITQSATGTTGVSGGNGGGIIFLRTATTSGSGTVSANGNSALTVTNSSGGGGGAGGTIVLRGDDLSTLTVTANGGDGGYASASGRGDGGAGGGGVFYSNSTVNSATAVGGKVNNTANTARGADGITNSNTTIGANCTPTLVTALRTTVPNVARSNNMQTTYVYTVSNTGGGITGLTASPSLGAAGGAGLFTYASMSSAIIQYTDGTSQTLVSGTDYNVTNPNSSTPTFTLSSNVVVPSGASVVFTFAASIANTAVVSTPYGSNAATSYLNPQRTTATATTTANAPAYASATGNGADVVTIVVPLPVKLTKFTVVAAGADAILNWETAQEVNNHYFEVERSLDGQNFQSVGTVAGSGTTILAHSYRFADAGAGLRTADVLYYRLRQVDYDGQPSFSPVRTVQFSRISANVALYPNPTTNSATLDLSLLPAGDYTVQVFETTGRVVQRGTYQPGKQTLSLENLPTGTYFVKVQGASLTKVLPLIKQ